MEQLIEEIYQKYLKSTGVCTDTRKIEECNIFFALKGPSFDGNKYAKKAIEAGASYAIVDDPSVLEEIEEATLVEDVLLSLQSVARHHRRQLGIPIIGITGSNGKTTTKELVNVVLSKKYKVFATQGNFNNHIGVPLTLLSIKDDTELAIVEMGANKPGDIKELSEIAEPNFGLITNIGKAHLEGFGSAEGVVNTKTELYTNLKENEGVTFINKNEPSLQPFIGAFENQKIYGSEYELTGLSPFIIFEDKAGKKYNTQLLGEYNFQNILTALAIGNHFSVGFLDAIDAVCNYVPDNNRSQIIEKGNATIVLDAYNANPSSMEVAIRSFDKMEGEYKMVVLGEMLELGEVSDQEHLKLLTSLKDVYSFSKVLLFGQELYKHKNEFPDFEFFQDHNLLLKAYDVESQKANLILIKGSRGNSLEKLVTP